METDKEEEVDWENIVDKRTRSIWITNGVHSSVESIRLKIFQIDDIELLESLRVSMGHISEMYRKFAVTYSKTATVDYVHSETRVNPNLKELRRMEIHSICCEIQTFAKNVKPYIQKTMIDCALGQFFNIMQTTGRFLEKVVMDNEIFHATHPHYPKKTKKITKFY